MRETLLKVGVLLALLRLCAVSYPNVTYSSNERAKKHSFHSNYTVEKNLSLLGSKIPSLKSASYKKEVIHYPSNIKIRISCFLVG